ncbi:MAG: T9SS type A sorting domain-containing protein, partial [Flavobacteriales bacterium]|nr:T9SS type A sorting domain-containing protein [Flavobacteriales bacterium]
IHPNPAHDAVILELDASGTVEYRLLDAVGRQVRQGQLATGATSRHVLDVAALNPGLYHLEVRSADGIGTARLIIE